MISTTRKQNLRRIGKVVAKKVVDEPVLLDVVQPDAMAELNQNAKSVVVKGKVVAKSPKKVAKKSPAKKVAKKSPVKKVAKKSPAKKVAKKSPAKLPRTRKTAVKKTNKKVVKSKRPHNVKPTALDTAGICVGPARVRSVLMHQSLNPREYQVRLAIADAENKPVRTKPTEEEPNPPEPEQGPQVNIEDMDANSLAVIHEAEYVHERTIREGYEREVLKEMNTNDKTAYLTARKKANSGSEDQTEFDLQAFNVAHDPKFYNTKVTVKTGNGAKTTDVVYKNYTEYAAGTDSYVVGDKYNQWSRASTLVNKLTIRLSGNTRYIVAAFLDRIVEQYAYNGITHCLEENRHIVQLRHALTQTDGFDTRVPLDRFIKTFSNYGIGLDWIDACKDVRDQVKQLRAEGKEVEFEYPSFPDMGYTAKFDEYVGEICRSVKMYLAEAQTDEEARDRYLNTSVSRAFKRFCSNIIYEAILRIGAFLRRTVQRANVKTISDAMVHYALEQVHNVCGMDFDPAALVMAARLAKFEEHRQTRKEERRRKKDDSDEKDENAQVVIEDDAVDDQEEDDQEEDDQEEDDQEEDDQDEEDLDEEDLDDDETTLKVEYEDE
jgi:hypothetical protein